MDYPIYPSTKIAISPPCYMDAVNALDGKPSIFCDGETILVPNSQYQTIVMLIEEFEGSSLEKNWGHEYEYATLAQAEGVEEHLVSLGNAVWDITGLSAEQMVQLALQDPEGAFNTWSALYRSSMAAYGEK